MLEAFVDRNDRRTSVLFVIQFNLSVTFLSFFLTSPELTCIFTVLSASLSLPPLLPVKLVPLTDAIRHSTRFYPRHLPRYLPRNIPQHDIPQSPLPTQRLTSSVSV